METRRRNQAPGHPPRLVTGVPPRRDARPARERASTTYRWSRDTSIVAGLTLAMFVLSVALTVPPPFPGRDTPAPALDAVAWAPAVRGDTLAPGGAVSQVLASRG